MMLTGKAQSYLSALVLLDHESVANHAQDMNVRLRILPRSARRRSSEIENVNQGLAADEKIGQFVIVERSFAADGREIAKGIRLNRSVIS